MDGFECEHDVWTAKTHTHTHTNSLGIWYVTLKTKKK